MVGGTWATWPDRTGSTCGMFVILLAAQEGRVTALASRDAPAAKNTLRIAVNTPHQMDAEIPQALLHSRTKQWDDHLMPQSKPKADSEGGWYGKIHFKIFFFQTGTWSMILPKFFFMLIFKIKLTVQSNSPILKIQTRKIRPKSKAAYLFWGVFLWGGEKKVHRAAIRCANLFLITVCSVLVLENPNKIQYYWCSILFRDQLLHIVHTATLPNRECVACCALHVETREQKGERKKSKPITPNKFGRQKLYMYVWGLCDMTRISSPYKSSHMAIAIYIMTAPHLSYFFYR